MSVIIPSHSSEERNGCTRIDCLSCSILARILRGSHGSSTDIPNPSEWRRPFRYARGIPRVRLPTRARPTRVHGLVCGMSNEFRSDGRTPFVIQPAAETESRTGDETSEDGDDDGNCIADHGQSNGQGDACQQHTTGPEYRRKSVGRSRVWISTHCAHSTDDRTHRLRYWADPHWVITGTTNAAATRYTRMGPRRRSPQQG